MEVIRVTTEGQRAGAYYVRIQGMAEEYHISQEEEFDELDGQEAKHILIRDDIMPVGTCRFYETAPGRAAIGRVVVLPEYRGKGIGRMLIEAAEEWIRELGYSEICMDSRITAVDFYRKLGYSLVSDEVYISGPFECVMMRKDL